MALILELRDLRHRASFVYYESILRYIGALLLIPAGLLGGSGYDYCADGFG